MDSTPFISIVIPLYNNEPYIVKCLDSIFTQTFENFECIVIDDGSTDNGLILCLEYAKKEKRLKVFHIENSGVCKARNMGIKIARGKWIAFIDSDDFIDENYFESFFPYLNYNSFCTHRALIKDFPASKTQILNGITNSREYNRANSDNYALLLQNHLIFVSSYLKLFNKDILLKNSILYDESIICVEDRLFVAEYLLSDEIRDIFFIDACSYHYVIHEGSLTTKPVPLRMFVDASMRWYKLLILLNAKFKVDDITILTSQKRFMKNQLIDVIVDIFTRPNFSQRYRFELYKYVKTIIETEFSDIRLDKGYQKLAYFIEKTPDIIGYVIFFLRFYTRRFLKV